VFATVLRGIEVAGRLVGHDGWIVVVIRHQRGLIVDTSNPKARKVLLLRVIAFAALENEPSQTQDDPGAH
jgi:transcription termination factor Rho